MAHALVFHNGGLERLRADLLKHSPHEAAAVLLAANGSHHAGRRLLVREAIEAPADAYLAQEVLRAQLSPMFLAPLVKRARTEGLSVVLVHTHPFSEDDVAFSWVDDDGERT